MELITCPKRQYQDGLPTLLVGWLTFCSISINNRHEAAEPSGRIQTRNSSGNRGTAHVTLGDTVDFRTRLKAEMNARGMTVKALAAASATPESTIKGWISPKNPAEPNDLQALKRVCTALGHTVESLYFGEQAQTQAVNELLRHITTKTIMSGWVKLTVELPAETDISMPGNSSGAKGEK